jgi:L-ribulose-5-phosphate 3-epimerase
MDSFITSIGKVGNYKSGATLNHENPEFSASTQDTWAICFAKGVTDLRKKKKRINQMFQKSISRRSFLKAATAAATGCVMADRFAGASVRPQADQGSPGNRKPAFRIGALDSVLSGDDRLSWELTYQRARELGFEGIELGVGKDYDQTELWNAEGRRRLRGVSEAAGVATPSICLHSYWTYSFADEDEVMRDRALRLAREAAIAAKEVGAGQILIPFTNPDSVGVELAQERWISGMKKSASAAEEAGVTYCLENVGISFADRPEDIIAIVDAVGSPAVKVYYDAGNAVRTGNDPLHAIPLLNKRIGQVHVKEVRGHQLGDGIVPWPGIIQALRGIGYSGWLMLETDATKDPKTAARKNLETVRGFLR